LVLFAEVSSEDVGREWYVGLVQGCLILLKVLIGLIDNRCLTKVYNASPKEVTALALPGLASLSEIICSTNNALNVQMSFVRGWEGNLN